MDGFINIAKPPGMTSSDVVLFLRKRLEKGTKVGHGGTLDPEAAGVLPLCVGKAARLFDYIIDKEKEYLAELALGVITDTQDATGRVERVKPVCASESEIRAVLPTFTGEIDQLPPMFSALKRDGKRLYELARKGEIAEIQSRRVQVYVLDYLGLSGANRHLIRVVCGKGTYVRTLMHDIGGALGCGGHMSFLLRTRAGAFDLQNAHTLEQIDEQRATLSSLLLPLDMPLKRMPEVHVEASMRSSVKNGCIIHKEQYREEIGVGEPSRIYCGEQFAGIVEADEFGSLRFRAMLL